MSRKTLPEDLGPGRQIAIVASWTRSLINFRLQLLKRMVDAGHEVTAFAPEYDIDVIRTLEGIGVRFTQIPMARTGLSPLGDLGTLFALWRHFQRMRPDIVLAYTMKPIIFGCLAARLASVPHRFALVTGLGYVFTDAAPSRRMIWVRGVSIWLYRLALVGAERVFVYNDADADEFRRNRIVLDLSRLTLVAGSGVDLDHYARSDPPIDPVTFLLVARLLRDKGIIEYVEAARLLRRRFPDVRVQLLGRFDSNPSGIAKAELDSWVDDGVIEYLGEVRDVRPFLARCTVFVLPSYREGMPRSILEAMAAGRAIITTDVPGCRDSVVQGENGLLVPPRDYSRLAAAMEVFVARPELAGKMGRRSRELAQERFDVHAVNQFVLGHMELI